ncbi:MAG: DNA polymerase III subunit delta [Bryobacteraceae bacterium]|nr:DNA polymerase III subunit delta [Bryobacteraceae bacterium]MDW8379819.1 DNA polymerase III subunit delta [Bryobacterales bacterium]
MKPQEFVGRIKQSAPAPVYLFLGPEMHRRRVCRRLLIEKHLPLESREEGFTRYDLEEIALIDVLDDALSLSLFAAKRLIWASSAEAALPKGALPDREELPAQAALRDYVNRPTPGVVIVFDSSRITYNAEDKSKMERLRKFYAAIPNVVEFHPYTEEEARKLAAEQAHRAGLQLGAAQLESLVESLGYDASRIVIEIEKLSCYAGGEATVSDEVIAALTPDARTATVFALVAALSRGDRGRSFELLQALVRDGEYLPLVLRSLSTQLRYALAAQEEGLRSASQVQNFFAKQGIAMWPSRAQQVHQLVTAFPQSRLEAAIQAVHEADKKLRDRSPDDRIVIEKLVLALT